MRAVVEASLMRALVTLLVLTAGGPALAQDRFDVQQLHPIPVQEGNGVGVYSAQVLPDAAFEVGLFGHFEDDPLVIRNEDDDPVFSVVHRQATLHLMGGFGLFDRLELMADLAFILTQSGDMIPMIPNLDVDASNANGGVGDARLIGKVLLYSTHQTSDPGGSAMALVVEGLFPTGDDESFQGDGGPGRFAARIAVDGVSVPGHRFSFNVGWTVRSHYLVPGFGPEAALEVDDTFDWGFAAQFLAGEHVRIIPEVRGSVVLTAEELGPQVSPMEVDLSVRVLPVEFLHVTVGGGFGLFQGFGAPDFRVFAGVAYRRVPPADRDGDGILNDDDACPDDPEDFDEFEDADGCPEPDNDHDGILDTPDQCPLEPEDRDYFEDENGCPDPDNDQDGILDDPDECPNDPEDRDAFEDDNGCPDPDNDQDGVLDDPDECPLDPEDRDGFEDDNGCPDPDNDQDRILDPVDRCPNEPETVNGNEDEDGCPDEEALVTVTCERIVIHDQVHFATNRAVIRPESFNLLNAVAEVFRTHTDIRQVRVEGHTDSRASDRHNLRLSDARANSVRDYIVGRGIEPGRLVAQGFGESQPIDSNATEAGRAANRRVELIITEQEGCRDQ